MIYALITYNNGNATEIKSFKEGLDLGTFLEQIMPLRYDIIQSIHLAVKEGE